MRSPALLLATLASARAANVLHERRDSTNPTSWRQVDRVQSDAIIPLRIGLKQNNLQLGEERLMAVSHPDSEHYGKYLSEQEVHDLFAPSDHAVNRSVE